MTTYSQLVDSLVLELRRPDLRAEIAKYLSQTLREVHFRPDSNAAVLYRDNLRESLLVANTDSSYGWDIPDEGTFQAMQAVRYADGSYPPEVTPSRRLAELRQFYYRAGTRYSFAGYGGINSVISIAYYEYPRRLKYFMGVRPATYDVDSGWIYAPEFDTTPELRAAARTLTTNWLLMRWQDVIEEGVRAKTYKRVSETDRMKTSYSSYTSLRMGLFTSESMDLGGYA